VAAAGHETGTYLLAAKKSLEGHVALEVAGTRPEGTPGELVAELYRGLVEVGMVGPDVELRPRWNTFQAMKILKAWERVMPAYETALQRLDDMLGDAVEASSGRPGIIRTADFGRTIYLSNGLSDDENVVCGIMSTLPAGHRLRTVLPESQLLLWQGDKPVLLLGPIHWSGKVRRWYPEDRAIALTREARQRQLEVIEKNRQAQQKMDDELARRYAESPAVKAAQEKAKWEAFAKTLAQKVAVLEEAAAKGEKR